MKKVTILSLHLGCGGAEQSICSLANQLAEDYKVEILSVYQLQEKPFFHLNPKVSVRYLVDFVPNNQLFRELVHEKKLVSAFGEGIKGLVYLYRKKKAVCTAVEECDADVLISTRAYFSELAGKHRKKGTKLYAWEHNHPHGNRKTIQSVVHSCRNADALICVGREIAEIYEQELRTAKCKVFYIPNFIENLPAESTCSLLKGKKLLACGRLEKEKGFSDLVRAFSMLHKKDPEVTLTIVGDGSQRESLQRLAEHAGIKDAILFTGKLSREKLNEYYRNSDLFVMTSHTESFGLVLLEAMAFGVPCIAFDSAEGACELIRDGENGFLIKERNCQTLVEKIKSYLNGDEKERQRLGQNAVQTAQGYLPERVMEKWRSLLGKDEI